MKGTAVALKDYLSGKVKAGKGCFLYVMDQSHDLSVPAYVKIGIAANVRARLSALQIGNPEQIYLTALWRFDSRRDAEQCERVMHKRLEREKVRGEWFLLNPVGAMCEIDEVLGLVE